MIDVQRRIPSATFDLARVGFAGVGQMITGRGDTDAREGEECGTERHERVGPQPRRPSTQLAVQAEQRPDERGTAQAQHDLVPADDLQELHARRVLRNRPRGQSRSFRPQRVQCAVAKESRVTPATLSLAIIPFGDYPGGTQK